MEHAAVSPKKMDFQYLEKITDGFSESSKLGSGSFGQVYRGDEWRRTGNWSETREKIAVKMLYDKLSDDPELNDEQFEKEYQNLASLQHPNIVQFVGYCHENKREYRTCDGKESQPVQVIKRALCFEYMKNGSLDKFLLDEHRGHDWHTRYLMIKGICKGLKYLHEELKSPMLHLDLKPGNILLDEKMMPKIADFGLSTSFAGKEIKMRKNSGEDSKVKETVLGTQGYVPPEYIDKGDVSIKFDIFSLGVLIINIMTGPEGYDRKYDMNSQEQIELALKNWSSRLEAISPYALETSSKQIKRCMEIGLMCVVDVPTDRPSIGNILNMLNESEDFIKSPDVVCPCICTDSESLDPKKWFSYPHAVTDSRGKVHEVTISTVCDPEDETEDFKLIPPEIKIISFGGNLSELCSIELQSIDVHPTEPW